MSIDLIAVILASLLLILLGIATMLGKADWAMKNYRLHKERYNIVRLRLIMGIMLIILGLILPFVVVVKTQNICIYVILGIAAVFGVLQETWARRR